MMNKDECCCNTEANNQDVCGCDCDCGHDDNFEAADGSECGCGCGHDDNCEAADGSECGCGCGHDDHGEGLITMTDTETGESYTFAVADDFAYEEDHYCVLVTVDNERDPEMIIAKVVKLDDGSDGLMSLDDAEYDQVYAEYERLCEEETDEDAEEEEPI